MTQQQQYFSPRDLAGLSGMPSTGRAILMMAERESWPSRPRPGRGGGREYPITCLPVETQAALAQRLLSAPAAGPSMRGGPASHVRGSDLGTPELVARLPRSTLSDLELQALAAVYEAKPQREKNEAAARLAIVNHYQQLKASGVARATALASVAAQHQVSVASITRYLALVAGQPEHAWLYLLTPRYCGRIAEAEMSAEAWEFIKGDYLRRERPSKLACITRLRRTAEAHGWTIPSTRTLLRRIERLPRALRVLAREGTKAAQQLYPAQARNKSALAALQIINGDGYLHNLWVRFPDGEIVRAKTWFWQDVYSSKVIGWRTDKTEHTDVIRLSFGDVVEQYGIPEAALIDNTRAAANKTMSGGVKHRFRFKVREDEPLGVFPLLNVDVRWATPAHGQAKPVERVYGVGGIGEYVDKAPDFAGAWTGGSPLDKPEYDRKHRAVELAELQAVIEREVAEFNARAGRRSPIHRGRSFDEVFEESYKATVIRRATEAQRRLWLLATEPVTCNRKDGAITLDAGRITRNDVAPTYANRYWAPELVELGGSKVVARFDPARLHQGVHVYTLDGRYIAFAECHAPQGFNDSNAGREHNRARKTYLRAQRQLLDSEVRMDALAVAKHLPGVDGLRGVASIPAPKVVRAEFRSPLERPRAAVTPMSEGDADMLARLEAEASAPARVNVHELKDDHAKHDYWLALKVRRDAGETLDAADAAFFQSWQQDAYYRFITEEEVPLAKTA